MLRLGFVMLLGCFVLAIAPGPCLSCPMCQDAVPTTSSTEEEDPAALARAYNRSIYLMVAVPYLLLGTVGFMVYRHLRVRAALEAAQLPPAQPLSPGDPDLSPHPGDRACPPPSPDAAS